MFPDISNDFLAFKTSKLYSYKDDFKKLCYEPRDYNSGRVSHAGQALGEESAGCTYFMPQVATTSKNMAVSKYTDRLPQVGTRNGQYCCHQRSQVEGRYGVLV